MDKANPFKLGRGVKLRPAEIALVLFMGLVVGLFLGYILMGTAHAMFDIGEFPSMIALHTTSLVQQHQKMPWASDAKATEVLLLRCCGCGCVLAGAEEHFRHDG